MVTYVSSSRTVRSALLVVVIALAGLVVPVGAPAAVAAAPARPTVTATVSAGGRFLAGERLWVTGKVSGSSAGRSVRLQSRPDGASGWTTVSRTSTRAGGRFTLSVRPSKGGRLRVVASATRSSASATSRTVTVVRETGSRTLTKRASTLAGRVGDATSARRTLTRSQRSRTGVKNVRKVVHQRFEKGLLVEVTTSSSRRTWLVTGTILRRYLADGGPSGRWGVPTSDARCDLAERGCVQSFAKGTLYAAQGDRRASSSAARGRRGEVFAVARSQVGYKDRYPGVGPHTTKYNAWVGSDNAWCSIFLSWSGAAAGQAAIPVAKSYPSFVSKVRASMPTGSKPRPGALAFVSTRPPHSEANHVMLVTSVSADGRWLNVIHGNYGPGGGFRGVTEQKWSTANRVKFYGYPRY